MSIFVHSSMFLPAFPLGRVAGQQLYVDPKYFTINSSFRKFPSVHTKTGPSKVGDVVTRHLVLEPLDCFPADAASRTCLVNLSWAILETWSNHPAWIFRIRKFGVTFRTLRISNLCFLSRSVIPWTLRKNPISAACSWESILLVVTRGSWSQTRIEKKTDLKTESFAIFESSSFHHGATKLT